MEGYTACLNQSSTMVSPNQSEKEPETGNNVRAFLKEIRGEVLLRIAMLKKEMGAIDQAMQMCTTINSEPFNESIRANALCLMVWVMVVMFLAVALNVSRFLGTFA